MFEGAMDAPMVVQKRQVAILNGRHECPALN
jgi:hypothetical protein